jgi:hypothetical protein
MLANRASMAAMVVRTQRGARALRDSEHEPNRRAPIRFGRVGRPWDQTARQKERPMNQKQRAHRDRKPSAAERRKPGRRTPRAIAHLAGLTVLAAAVILIAACGDGGANVAVPSLHPSPAPSVQSTPPATQLTGTRLSWSQPNLIADSGVLLDVVQWRGGYVAVGQASDGGQIVGAAFASPDGVRWQRTTTGPTFAGVPLHIAATDSRLIAIATRPGPPLSVDGWVSTDGMSWTPQSGLHITAGAITGLAARGETIVAVGADANNDPTLWRSAAAATWTQPALPSTHAIVRNVVAIADGFVALGREGQPDSGAGAGAPGVGRPAAWWSADGMTWRALTVEGTEAPGAQLIDAFPVAAGYLASGSDTTTPSVSARSPLLWAAVNGQDWRLVGPPAHWGAAGANGRQIIVLTGSDPGAATLSAWLSEDGRTWNALSFTGDLADVPAFAATEPNHLDRIFIEPRGVIVIGQRSGHPTAWFAEEQP